MSIPSPRRIRRITSAIDGHAVTNLAITALFLIWLAAILIVNPSGDFPILDDWAYGHAVRTLVAEHRFQLTDWTSVPLAAQLLWGALFCLPAGFSFTALRVSTLVLAWLAGVGVYALMRTLGADRLVAVAAAAALLFCPVFFGLAFTFMTDVPFVACAVWGCVFAARYIIGGGRADWPAAAAAFTAATLIRHIGVAVAAGATVAVIVRIGDAWDGSHTGPRPVRHVSNRRYWSAAAITLIPLVALLAYNAILARIGTPALYHFRDAELAATLAHPLHAARLLQIRSLQSYVYLGLFLSPVLCFVSARLPRVPLIALTVLPAAVFLIARHRLPLVGTTWHDLGLNPINLPRRDLWPTMPPAVWYVLTLVGIAGGAVALSAILGRWRTVGDASPRRDRATALVCAAPLLCYFVPSALLSDFMDRYLLTPLGLALALLAAFGVLNARSRGRAIAATVILGMAAVFDVSAMHDFLSYNRARWTAIHDLVARGMPAASIDGGTYEVNGWINYRPGSVFARGRDRWYDGSVDSPAAVLSLGPLDGYRVTATYPFSRWIGTGPGTVAVLQPLR